MKNTLEAKDTQKIRREHENVIKIKQYDHCTKIFSFNICDIKEIEALKYYEFSKLSTCIFKQKEIKIFPTKINLLTGAEAVKQKHRPYQQRSKK